MQLPEAGGGGFDWASLCRQPPTPSYSGCIYVQIHDVMHEAGLHVRHIGLNGTLIPYMIQNIFFLYEVSFVFAH